MFGGSRTHNSSKEKSGIATKIAKIAKKEGRNTLS
jgi:hypothetical protein